jgi:threonine aldolase
MFPESKNPEAQFIGFASDNYSGAHPRVLEWIEEANKGYARPYNDDIYTTRFRSLMNQAFGKEVAVFPSLNGTGTNVFALRSLLPRWGTVCAPETAHINTDEAGAPEHMAGLKIMTAPTKDGKMLPSDIEDLSKALGDIHSAQPAIVSISNTTERGTVYNAQELGLLAHAAHSHGMLIHVDGARIFNAIATLGYNSINEGLKDLYGDTGIDALSFGGTKVGAMSAEAVVVLHPAASPLVRGAKFSQKQMGQLASKARYSSAQFLALLEDDLALDLAKKANENTQKLFKKYVEVTGAVKAPESYLVGATSVYASGADEAVEQENTNNSYLYQSEPEANAFFPTMPTKIIKKMRETHHFYDIASEGDSTTIRLMCSWQTSDKEIAGFEEALKKAIK